MEEGKTQEKIVYFVRHGQSIGNVSPVYQHYDSPLSPIGEKQAGEVALKVAELGIDCLISSPQSRALQTANAITKATGIPPEFNDLFVERIKPRSVDGALHTDSKASEIYWDWNESIYTSGVKIEDGENYDEITDRAVRALNFLSYRNEKVILVVTHSFFIRTMIAKVLVGNRLTPAIYKRFLNAGLMTNTGLSALKYKKGEDGKYAWRLWIYNDHSHLSEK